MFHLDEYVGLPDRPSGELPQVPARAPDSTRPASPAITCSTPSAIRRGGGQRRPRAGERADRRRVRRHRRERPPRVQRSARRLRHRRSLLIVALDEACRRQQVGEGWFTSLEAVPAQALSMSIQQILKANDILCIVPDSRKAAAVKCEVGRRDHAGRARLDSPPALEHDAVSRPRLGGAAGSRAGAALSSRTPTHDRSSCPASSTFR